jgi:potassium voltage-gated channel Shab-related subfamily B member 1
MDILNENRIILNVGGERHEVLWKSLSRLPNSRLGKIFYLKTQNKIEEIKDLCDDYNPTANELFFDRYSNSFGSLLSFYRTGKLHLIDNICVVSFHEDLNYWGIEECFLESCCQLVYQQKRDYIQEEMRKAEEAEKEKVVIYLFNDKSRCFPRQRSKIWDLMENPNTSKAARIIAYISIFFIVLSTIVLTLNTIPEFQIKTNITNENRHKNDSSILLNEAVHVDNPIFEIIEAICIAWFSFEFIVRFFSSPDKLEFMKGSLNIIDLISFLPYYIALFIPNHSSNFNSGRRILTLFRALRILRIFKLARHSTGLQSLGYTLQQSKGEIGLLGMFLSIAVLLFSSLIYFSEKEEELTQFTSIPHSFWWAFITITSKI